MMKKKQILSCALSASLVTLSLVGCSDYDNGYTSKEIAFQTAFRKQFGDIDPEQDWNMAERASVTVTTSHSSDIKIYAKNNDVYSLVGHYSDVTGTQTLDVDVIEGTTDIMVSDGVNSVFAKVGESVTIGDTRVITKQGENNDGSVTVQEADEYRDFGDEYIETVQSVLEEEADNRNKVTDNFTFVSTGESFTFYPLFFWTDSYHILGIYWQGNDGQYHWQDIYETKTGDELVYRKKNESDSYDYEHTNKDSQRSDNWGNWTREGYNLASKAITVTLPKGTKFGFYLEVYNKDDKYYHTVYSEARLNKEYSEVSMQKKETINGWDGNNMTQSPEKGTYEYAATFTKTINGKLCKFFCFEDWNYKPDLNDLIFMFDDSNVELIPETSDEDETTLTSWIISAEDLGSTFDIDYNDVVIEVQHVSGENKAKVTPLAAGGTLASYVFFGEQCVGEIHGLLNERWKGDNITSGAFIPLNASPGRTTKGTTIDIEVPADFTLADYLDKSTVGNSSFDKDNAHKMGGFNIRVVPSGTVASEVAATVDGQRIQNVLGNEGSEAPYVICTPKYWTRTNDDGTKTTGHYRWSKETYPMTSAYSGTVTFADWVADKNKVDWYKYPDVANTCAPEDVKTGSGSEGGDDKEPQTPTPPVEEKKLSSEPTLITEYCDLCSGGNVEGIGNFWKDGFFIPANLIDPNKSLIIKAMSKDGEHGHQLFITDKNWSDDIKVTLSYSDVFESDKTYNVTDVAKIVNNGGLYIGFNSGTPDNTDIYVSQN